MPRFAILAGVSTDAQATPDKRSISDQIAHCRTVIAAHHGDETAGPFVMDGYSRTGYDSLDVAMISIPPLGAAVRAAMSDQYDILIMDNFDRLGDLGLIVKTRFRKLRKQLHSARQSGRIIPPDQYDPYAAEDTDIAMYVEGIIQSYRINKIRRGWNIGVPQRARTGLHPLSLPFGYKSAGKDQPAEQVPEQVALLYKIKDWFLEGLTLTDICARAEETGIRPPRADHWNRALIRRLLENRYYSGIVTFGKYRTVENKRIPVPPSQWITSPGKHTPLWDDATHQRIQLELERRDATRARAQTYAITGLLTCAHCGKRLHRHGRVDSRYPVEMQCPSVPAHVVIRYDVALKLVAGEITRGLQKHALMPSTGQIDPFQKQLDEMEEQRRLVQAGYQSKIYTQEEAARLITALETDIGKLTARRDRAVAEQARAETRLSLAPEHLEGIREWIIQDEPTTVNRLLTALCQTITITSMYHMEIIWR